jgi:hypothetical protein
MTFAQLTYRESLREIVHSVPEKCSHLGLPCSLARSTLSDAMQQRDWRIFADFAQILIEKALFYINMTTTLYQLKFRFLLWMRQQLIYVYRCFLELRSAQQKRR